MDKKIQSRRQFFKNAAKKALPVIGAITMVNMPIISNAVTRESYSQMDCNYGCSGGCSGYCSGGCSGGCRGGCSGCSGGCSGGCSSSCRGASS